MNAPTDPKTVKPVQVTTGGLPGSRKVYSEVPGFPGRDRAVPRDRAAPVERRAALPRVRYVWALHG